MAISLGTGGTGGIYYPYGGGVAEIITKHVPDLTCTAEVTAASVANVRMVHTGELQMGEIMNDVGWEAYNGAGRFEGEKLADVRALFQMYPHHWYFVTLEKSPIYTIEDMVGKRVSSGAPGSGTEYQFTNMITALGYTQDDFKISRLSFSENVTALRDGTIDVGSWSVGSPVSSVLELSMTHDIRIIPFSPEEQEKIVTDFPFYFKGDIPGGIYRGVDEVVPSVCVGNIIVVREDMQYRAAYEIVKAVFGNLDYLRMVHAAAEGTTLELGPVVPIPLHPGAERYFKDKGVL